MSSNPGFISGQTSLFFDEDGNIKYEDDDGSIRYLRDEEGSPYYTNYSAATRDFSFDMAPLNRQKLRSEYTTNYEGAKDVYGYAKVKWDYSAVQPTETSEENIQGGLSTREPFNLNALWGGTQYSAGRVSDFSHIDSTQLEANKIASEGRDALWDTYDKLVAQGVTPPKNPDQIALDFYVKNVGQEGNNLGYGPGANTMLLREALFSQFLNQPEVVDALGAAYQTPPELAQGIADFGKSHSDAVSTWQVFEQQGMGGRDWFGALIPAIIGAIAFPGLSSAFAGTLGQIGAGIAAGALIGGVTAEINDGDVLKGILTGGISGGLGASGAGGAVTKSLTNMGINPIIARGITQGAASGLTAAVVGGDVGQAILSGAFSGAAAASTAQLASVLTPSYDDYTGQYYGAATPELQNIQNFFADNPLAKTALLRGLNAGAMAIVAGKDPQDAVTNTILNAGIGGALGDTGLDNRLANILAPIATTALTGGNVEGAFANAVTAGMRVLGNDLIKADIKAAGGDPTKVAEAQGSSGNTYDENHPYWTMTAAADTGTTTDAPSTPVSSASTVIGAPYMTTTAPEGFTPPEGTRLATPDEAEDLINSGVGARDLGGGVMAYLLPVSEYKDPEVTTEQLTEELLADSGTMGVGGEAPTASTDVGYDIDGLGTPATGAGAGVDSGADAGAGVDSGADAGAGVDSGADAGAGIDSGADAGAGVDSEADAGAGVDSEADAGAGVDSGVDAGIDTTGLATSDEVTDVKDTLSKAIDDAVAAGKAGDEALQEAIGAVSADLGITKTEILDTLGTTEANLRDEFGTQLGEATSALSGEITDVKDTLSKAIDDAVAAGKAGDEALQEAIGAVSADLGITKTEILDTLGTTEANLRDEFGTQLGEATSALSGEITGVRAGLEQNIAETTAATQRQITQTAKEAEQRANFGTLLSLLTQPQQAAAPVPTPDPAKIGYIYDWSSIFANPAQAQLFGSATPYSPYGTKPAPKSPFAAAQGGYVKSDGDDLLEVNEALLRLIRS